MDNTIPVALVGIGKIATDQHVPALRASDHLSLVATVSRHGTVEGVPAFKSLADLAASSIDVRCLSICTPPIGRLALVKEALALGYDVMIEKPPAATVSEAEAIVAAAHEAGRTLFVTWHSREAAAVDPARAWLADRTPDRMRVNWKENVRVWHPGQDWIWEPGIGVFDPGINALSVITSLMPEGLLVESAELRFPANRDAPIAASLRLRGHAPVEVEFDFDQLGEQTWEIEVEAGGEAMRLTDGATRLFINGHEQAVPDEGEYPRLYRRLADLLAAGASDSDLSPFRLVADAFTLGRRKTVGAFSWTDGD